MEDRENYDISTCGLRGRRSSSELPIHIWCATRGSNSEHSDLESDASAIGLVAHLAFPLGFEPRFPGVGDPGAFHGREELATHLRAYRSLPGLEDRAVVATWAMEPLGRIELPGAGFVAQPPLYQRQGQTGAADGI